MMAVAIISNFNFFPSFSHLSHQLEVLDYFRAIEQSTGHVQVKNIQSLRRTYSYYFIYMNNIKFGPYGACGD